MGADDIMTIAECASYLKVHKRTILRWIRKGKIRAFKVGREYRLRKDRVLEDLEYQPDGR